MPSQPPPFNPYASPQAIEELVPPSPGTDWDGLWRDGKDLVMHRNARLPDICLKTNQPADGGRLPRKLHWYPSWLFVLVLVSPLIFIIVALIVQKKATIEIGVSESTRRRRLRGMWLGTGIALLGLAVCIGMGAADPQYLMPLAIAVGAVSIVVGLLVGISLASVVKASRITDTHIWLRGVHSGFLARLPPLAG